MEDNIGLLCVHNGSISDIDKMGGPPADCRLVYEVIRIIDLVPLFLEDHYERMVNSLSALGMRCGFTVNELNADISRLAAEYGETCFNAKVLAFECDGRLNRLVYISKSYYPSKDEDEKGVPASLFGWERSNPNVKLVNHSYKEAVAKRIAEDAVFEVLLVNSEGKITEGSRSNAFFVKGNRVFTAPGDIVLKGITRKYVLQACADAGLEIVEQAAEAEKLDMYEGAFISGTSIKALPLSAIDGRELNSAKHPAVLAVKDRYNAILSRYIAGKAEK